MARAEEFEGENHEEREQETGTDVDKEEFPSGEGEGLDGEIENAIEQDEQCGIAQESAPFHATRRGGEVFALLVGRTEFLKQPRGDEGHGTEGGGSHAWRAGEDVDGEAKGKGRHKIEPTRRVERKDDEKIDIRHGGGITEEVDMPEKQHLQEQQEHKPAKANENLLNHRCPVGYRVVFVSFRN